MKVKMKRVYYCGYCKKHSLRPLTKHELHCTGNPNRQCGLCKRLATLADIVDKYKGQTSYTEEQTEWGVELCDVRQPLIENIREELEGCPLCTFAVCRQVGLTQSPFGMEGFDLRSEMQAWWSAINEDAYPEPY